MWVGDLNINLLDYNSVTTDCYKTLLLENGLECLVEEPTRITEQSQTCLDHVFARVADKSKLEVSVSVVQTDVTDHCMLRVAVLVVGGGGEAAESLSAPRSPPRCRIDLALLDIAIDGAEWTPVYVQTDASSAFDAFFEIFKKCMSQSTVECESKDSKIKKLKPWITDTLCLKIKKRNHLYSLTKKHSGNVNLKKYYTLFKNKLHTDIRRTKENYYRQKFDKCKGDSKATWKLINTLTGQSKQTHHRPKIKLDIDNELIEDSLTVANEFNNFFLDIVNQINLSHKEPEEFDSLPYKNVFPSNLEMKTMFIDPVSKHEILSVINSLKNNSSPGMDGVSSQVIKRVATKIINVLEYIINFSLESGTFPSNLKNAVVIPIFKNGAENKCNNYRPISLLSCFSKIYEKIMKQKLIKFLEITHFFSNRQFGFRSGMNTENALINFMSDVYDGLNENKCVSGLFLDIKKAFDTVDHNILLDKLQNCGIRGLALAWFKSYLIGRKQCVRINSIKSILGEISQGVPQGSVLGAILFIIYINDLCNARLKGRLTAFADDTALCYSETTWDTVKEAMTKDLEALQWWFSKNHMLLSTEKTKFINFNLRKDINIFNEIPYRCANCLMKYNGCPTNKCSIIQRTDQIKYLGIYLDSEVSWKVHLYKLKGKIRNILRYFYFLKNMANQQVLRALYFALVQSRMEYGIVLWGNAFSIHFNLVYYQQKHIVRLISSKGKFEHSRPLFLDLNILPLKNLFVYKVLKLFFEKSGNRPKNENMYIYKLRNPNVYIVPKPKNTFFTRTYNFIAPRIFNNLPNFIKLAENKISFLNKLRKWLTKLDSIDDLIQIQQ